MKGKPIRATWLSRAGGLGGQSGLASGYNVGSFASELTTYASLYAESLGGIVGDLLRNNRPFRVRRSNQLLGGAPGFIAVFNSANDGSTYRFT